MTGLTPERIAEIRGFSRLYDENPGFERQWDCSSYVPELLDEIEALTAQRQRRAGFAFHSYEGVDIVCGECNRGPTLAEDRDLFNLADYVAWADRHQCEVRT